jgi:hypothetical protein
MDAMYVVRVNDDGQIAEHWGVVDTIGTMMQLGLLPSPGQTPPTAHDRADAGDHARRRQHQL